MCHGQLVIRSSPNQPIRRNQKRGRVFLKIPSQAENWESSDCEVFGQFSWSFMKHHEQFRSCTKNRLYPTPNRNDIMDLVTYQTLSTTGMVNKENVTVTERTLCIKNCLLWRWDCDIKGMMTYQTLWPIGYVTQRADSNVSYTHYQRIICDDVSV